MAEPRRRNTELPRRTLRSRSAGGRPGAHGVSRISGIAVAPPLRGDRILRDRMAQTRIPTADRTARRCSAPRAAHLTVHVWRRTGSAPQGLFTFAGAFDSI